MPQRTFRLSLRPLLSFVSHLLLPKAFFELSVCLTPICTHNYNNMDGPPWRGGVTEEGPLTAAAAAGLIFQSLSLPLLCNIDVANTMLLPTDRQAQRQTGRPAGRLPSAQTVTQTRRLLQFRDTMDAASAIAVYKRAPLRVRDASNRPTLNATETEQTDFS